jgi:DNA gyrase/topoisomerase IV subunit B
MIDNFTDDENCHWKYELNPQNDLNELEIVFLKYTRGVATRYTVKHGLFNTMEFTVSSRTFSSLGIEGFDTPLTHDIGGEILNQKTEDAEVIHFKNLTTLARLVEESSRKGLSMQRFKGLGEMNPEQLWETTLDPEARVLMQVKINDAEIANETFSILMGDVVEPRKNFIVSNALRVDNLDV